jgi:uncharacterized DUF497 family protein
MAYFEFIWTDRAVQKLADHGLIPEDAEAVICDPTDDDVSVSSGHPVAFGYTSDGRYIIVVYLEIDDVTVEPVTAYEVPEPRWRP